MSIFSKVFMEETAVRAVRTFAQGMLAVIGGAAFDVWSADWKNAVGVGLSAATLSVLMSFDRGAATGSTAEEKIQFTGPGGSPVIGCGDDLRGF